ncbi:ABC transporter ATP-binding protein, partial [Gordonia terrae]
LGSLPGVYDFEADGVSATFTVDDAGLSAVTRTLAAHEIRALAVEPPSLEELFLHTYSDAGDC